MKTLIVPTDFSPVSLNAANYAADLAATIGAELLLVNIVAIPISTFDVPITQATFSEMEQDVDEQLVRLKEQLLSRTSNKINITTFSTIGNVEYDLQEIAGKKNPVAIIMGPKSSGTLERYFSGSNTLAAVHHIHYPVLVIPEKVSFKNIERVVLAADLEEKINPDTINKIKNWITFFKASFDIIHVITNEDISSTSMVKSITLQNDFSELHPEFHFVNQEKTETGINQFIEKHNTDLLIVIPRNRTLIESIFHKSHSKNFVLYPQIPVLAITENE